MKNLIVLLTTLFYCSLISAQENKYPTVNTENVKANELIVVKGETENKEFENYPKSITTTFGTIVVPENREKKNSRLITLPVKKLHSFSKNPKEPIFLLYGGPGLSNLRKLPFIWLLENHDIVMVGFRGVEGQVILESPGFPKSLATDGSPFSTENLKKMGEETLADFNNLKNRGIDVDAYNMIEVIDDFEAVKNALGYKKINLFSFSYGTRVAYLYGLRHPKSINFSLMEAVNPPGCFVWEPKLIDNIFHNLGELWKKNTECVAKSSDILKTISTVLESLPKKWNEISVNPYKVKIMMFMMAYTGKGFAQIFDAFVAAEKGDYSGLAFLNMAYDQLPNMPGMNWGDNLSKAFSADFDSKKDYVKEMDPDGSVIGAPMSKLFGFGRYGGWPIKKISEEYRKLRVSKVRTLLLSGTIDVSTPAPNGTKMLKYLPNGDQVILTNRGHQDFGNIEKEAYHTLVNTFFQKGKVDDSGFTDVVFDFNNVKPSFQDMGAMMYSKYKK